MFPFVKHFVKKKAYRNTAINNLKSIPVNIYDKQLFAARTRYRDRSKQRRVFFIFVG